MSSLYAQSDYQSAMQALMPRGRVWPRDTSSVQAKVLAGLANTFATSDAAAQALLTDAFPVAPVNLLPEWQTTLGLPDPCQTATQTQAQQQAAVAAKFAAAYTPTPAGIVSYCAHLGFPVSVQEYRPFKFGDAFGAPMLGTAWAYAFALIPQTGCPPFEQGMRCEIGNLAPARTVPIVQDWLDFNFNLDTSWIS